MKSKLFGRKTIIPICIALVLIVAFSIFSHYAIVVPGIKRMEHEKEYMIRASENENFLVSFADDKNGKKYGRLELFEGGRFYLSEAYVPTQCNGTEITTITDEAFSGFNSLEKVVVSESIKSIGKNVFKDSKNIKEIYIPASVKKIGDGSFDGINDFILYAESGSYAESFATKNSIKCESYNPKDFLIEEADYSKAKHNIGYKEYIYSILYDGAEPICAINGYNSMADAEKVTVPSKIDGVNVNVIAEGAFNGALSKEIVLPDTVTRVGKKAFSGCGSLEKVYFTENVSYIDEAIFLNSSNAVICAPKDSYAHKYAEENKIEFEEYSAE